MLMNSRAFIKVITIHILGSDLNEVEMVNEKLEENEVLNWDNFLRVTLFLSTLKAIRPFSFSKI